MSTKFKCLFFFFLCLSKLALSQKNQTISIGTIDTIKSEILHETRNIWVHVPAQSVGKRYPVVYLLDGDQHFFSVQGLIQQLSSVNGNTLMPEMIIVGIPNTDRTRELTPTHGEPGPMADSSFVSTSGGGEKFISFIEKELMPHIDSLFPTAPYRIFIGHSLGGLTVVNTLINHSNLFNAYIAIDPSMWWDRQKLLGHLSVPLLQKAMNGKSFFLGMANTMSKNMDTAVVQNDTTAATIHIRSILQLGKMINACINSNPIVNWKYYPNDDHGSVPMIAAYDALRSFFSFYKFQLKFSQFMDKHFSLDSLVRLHFKNVSVRMGYEILPQETLVNEIADALPIPAQSDRAFRLYKMNVDNYPDSYLALEAMSSYFNRIKNEAEAKRYHQLADSIRK